MVDDRDPFLSPRGWTIDDDEQASRSSKGRGNPFRGLLTWGEGDPPRGEPAREAESEPDGGDEGLGCWAEGRTLVLLKGGWLPDRCVRCGARAGGVRLRRTFSWHPPLVYGLLALNAVIYMVVCLFVRRTADVAIPLCPGHRAGRIRSIALACMGVPGGIAFMMMTTALPDSAPKAGLMLAGMVIFLGSLVHGIRAWPVLSARRIDPSMARLKGASPRFLAGLPSSGLRQR